MTSLKKWNLQAREQAEADEKKKAEEEAKKAQAIADEEARQEAEHVQMTTINSAMKGAMRKIAKHKFEVFQ